MRMTLMLLALLLAGCAATNGAPPRADGPPVDPVSRAAALLAEAARAESNADNRLRAVKALDQLAVTRAADSDDDPIAQWRADAIARGAAFIPDRGRALGPAYRSGWLDAGASKTLDQIFLAGKVARIVLSSPDRQPLALTITAPAGATVCRENGPPPGECQWTALYTGRYRIEIVNPGTARQRYFLVTN